MTIRSAVGIALLGTFVGLGPGCYEGLRGAGQNSEDGAGEGGDVPGDGAGSLSCETVDVGPTELSRLTRGQYDNTVNDLLGMDVQLAAGFPTDGSIGPFARNASPVDELTVDKYMRAAEELAEIGVDAVLPCDPSPSDEAACARRFVEDFGLRAYRRPLGPPEVEDYLRLFVDARAESTFPDAIAVVLEAMLQSPYFLYRLEIGQSTAAGTKTADPEVKALGPYEIATRLSYFLWNTMPDDALLAAAAQGELSAPEGLEAQAIRMLGDDKAKGAVAAFHQQWTGMAHLMEASKDSEMFPGFDDELKRAMVDESAAFVDYVVRQQDGSLETLLTADYSLPPPRVLELYGEAASPGRTADPSTPVPLDASRRSGLLTLPGFLAVQAHATQTSPVLRGLFIRENLLCQELPPPPPSVDNTPPEPDPNATTKERFERHTADPACAGCHVLIDPIGWAFEHYDAVGRFREREGELAVDARGELAGTQDADGSFDGAVELLAGLARSEQVQQCYAAQWFRFATLRLDTEADACSLNRAQEVFAASEGTVSDLILALIQVDAFHYRRSPMKD